MAGPCDYECVVAAKDLLPLSLRTRLKWVGAAVLDAVTPVTEPRVPARRHTTIGGGDFKRVGESFAERLIAEGLRPDDALLDIGCGQGRMARPLVGYLTGGRYEGFDIDARAVAWCREAYRAAPRFAFTHADVFNARYNAAGMKGDYRFPFPDGLFDAALATSVFTHMFEADIAHYLRETSRVLEPGGFALVTAFLKGEGPGELGFAHKLGENSWTTVPEMPEAAVAVGEVWWHSAVEAAGLRVVRLDRGSCWRGSADNVQDVMVLRKL